MTRWLGVVLAVVVAAVVPGPTAAASAPVRYVALGDSSAAGPWIPDEIDSTCLRSNRNWPHVLAGRLRAALTDVTCSGAKTTDLAGRQAGVVPPQFDALRRDTDLVTLAIAANDVELGGAFVTCANRAPGSATCRERSGWPARWPHSGIADISGKAASGWSGRWSAAPTMLHSGVALRSPA